MASKPLSSKKPVAVAQRAAAALRDLASPAETAAKRRRVLGSTLTRDHGSAPVATGAGAVEPGAYLPLASDSRTARSHRVLAPTLKPTRVSEEQIAEAVRNFRRN